jgi:hypothetical protein
MLRTLLTNWPPPDHLPFVVGYDDRNQNELEQRDERDECDARRFIRDDDNPGFPQDDRHI